MMIETRGLRRTFKSRTGPVEAVRGVDLRVDTGEIFGFLGPNGAGKTTTIRLLTGLLRPTRGTALVAGFDVQRAPQEVKRRVGYLAETPYLYPKLTGREFLRFLAELYSIPRGPAEQRIERLLALFELSPRADQLIEGYSHGMRQKLALAGAILHEPPLLFLDEPTSGLDPRSARLVKDLLAVLVEQGHTVFLSTHVLEIAEQLCHRVGIIADGELIATGSLDELRQQARREGASLEELFLQLTGGAEERQLAAYLRG
jgi:ABC-2 type transport system ATP-binding protein